MKYKTLGNTGLKVSALCLGTMTFGDKGYFKIMGGLSQQPVNELVKHAIDSGINFIDTANIYAEGMSEELTGQAIRDLGLNRDELVLATKVSGRMGNGQNNSGLSKKHILQEAEASLRRLNTDYIDLYQIHSYDPSTPVEETLSALDSLVSSGKVRYIGASNIPAFQLMKALAYSTYTHVEKFVSLQAYYSLGSRDLERELIPLILDQKLGLMVWSPLSSGLLTGKYGRSDEPGTEGRLNNNGSSMITDMERLYHILDVLRPMSEAKGTSIAQLALAWLLHQPAVTSIIVGATKLDQLTDNIKSLEVTFTTDELQSLNEVSKLPSEYPASLFERVANIKF